MNMQGINAGMQSGQTGRALGHAKRAENTPTQSASTPTVTENEASNPLVETNTHTKGVVRLLQEGHFRGVADVRLRINFNDELTQVSLQSVQIDFSVQFADFEQGVQEAFDAFLSTTEATEEQSASALALFDAFKATANDLATTFLEGGGSDFSSVAAELETIFDALVSDLEALFTPEEPPIAATVTEPAGEGNEIPEGGVDVIIEETPLEEFRVALSAILEQLVASIEESALALPELSEPQGNGVAYNKFLEMLAALSGEANESSSEPAMPEIIV